MSTVIPNKEIQVTGSPSSYPAPKRVLKNTYELVLGAAHSGKKLILVTGGAKKGKTSLIHTISKDLSTKNRTINLSGKDLPNLDPSNRKKDSELNLMKDFILESTDLEDSLVVTLDDADCLPISFLGELIEHTINLPAEKHLLQLILTGPTGFKEQLLAVEHLKEADISHFTIDTLSEEQIDKIAKEKTYKISSNIKNLKFKPGALHTLSEFIQNDRQLLDVVLEWCAALIKKDQLTAITSNTVSRAAGFARKFSKDRNLRLSNAYPPSHEVYKYINEIEVVKKTKRPSTEKVNRNNLQKVNQTKPFIETKNKTTTQETKIPTITSKVDADASIVEEEIVLENLRGIEDEIIPIQKIPAKTYTAQTKRPFPTMAALIGLLVLGFITFIGFRIGSDPVSETVEEEIADNKVTSEQLAKAETQATTAVSDTDQKEVIPDVKTKQTGAIEKKDAKISGLGKDDPITEKSTKNIIASDTNKPSLDNKVATKTDKNILKTPQQENDTKTTLEAKDSKLEPTTAPNSLAENEIKSMLALANYQFENKQLTTPAGDNALETYKKLIAKYPSNKAAADGIKKVKDKYISWGNYYLQQNDLKRAKRFYNKALEIDAKDTVALKNLQTIAQQEAQKSRTSDSLLVLQDATPTNAIEKLMVTATQKMQQIENDIKENKRNYRIYQEAQTAYQDVLKSQPQNRDASNGLSLLKKYYSEWAELQIQSQNYNIALFLYGQALSIEPSNTQIVKRIEQIRELKQAL